MRELRCEPPLTVRQVRSEAEVGLCLVGTAAGPLPGDDLGLELAVERSVVSLTATGASIAQGRDGGLALLQQSVRLGGGSHLTGDPGPLVVCAGADVAVAVSVDLAEDAHVEWHELLVLGRSDETGGAVRLRWDVCRSGRPVLRQSVDLADPLLRRWPGMAGGCRVLATTLLSGPGVDARTVVASSTAVAQRIDDRSLLVTVLAQDAATAVSERQRLLTTARKAVGALQ